MSQKIEASILRILNPQGSAIGAGFLVSNQHALTCAHVVASALGIQSSPAKAPQDPIRLDFPLLAARQVLTARVVAWEPDDDAAVLELPGKVPAGAQPAELFQADSLWDHPFRAFGFPAGFENGVWASGRILGRESTGWLQIEDIKGTGYFVQPGFSGGPIWDEQLGGVAGMTVAADTRAEIRAAFVLPVDILAKAWPALKETMKEVRSIADDSPAPGEAPFKGLQYFDVEDSFLFFGREALTRDLLEHIRDHQFLAVVGASGSGKSSVVRAGLVAALRGQPNWQIHVVTPTARPLETLALKLTSDSESVTAAKTLREDMRADPECLHLYARRLLPADSQARLLLVVDQFEELFTQCRDASEREAYITNLMTAASPQQDGPITVVLTLRADFYHHCMEYQALRTALEKYQKNIGTMTEAELRQAIEAPAAQAGWIFEPGLVDLMLRDVSDEPGALPLLSHALLATWGRRRGRTMTLAGYSDAGGVHGAIAKTAEQTYQRLSPEQRTIARNIFLRLTELGEGTQDTRRRASLDELVGNQQDRPPVDAVLKALADARLVTTGAEGAEVAHEALIREWPTLRLWLDEDREALRVHRHLTESAQSWEARGRDSGDLYRGTRLAQCTDWAKNTTSALSPLEKEFITASQAALAKERHAARLRWAGIAGALLFAAAILVLALTGQFNRLIYHPLPMEWIQVPAGKFMMGREFGESDESPVHEVYLDTFEIGKYEVTNQQYKQCVRAGVCGRPGNQRYSTTEFARHPVTDISWYDEEAFCSWVGGRLPTEAEWEYTARGTDERTYPWGEGIDDTFANYASDDTTEVGSYEKGVSPFGAYDMAGNVWEWTADWYSENYYAISPVSNPTGPEDGDYKKVLRGGSWDEDVLNLRVSGRAWGNPDGTWLYVVGFRCARSVASP